MSGGAGGQVPVCSTCNAPGKIHAVLMSKGGNTMDSKNSHVHLGNRRDREVALDPKPMFSQNNSTALA